MDIANDMTGRQWVSWVLAAASALLLTAMIIFLYTYPHRGLGPRQPIYFSHRVHAGVKGINCRFCHSGVDRSRRAGLPTVEKCLYCHNYIIPLHPQIVKGRRHYETRTPIPWIRIFYVPDHVIFNHQPHILKGIECRVCHGDVARKDRLQRVDFKMGFCISCHKEMKAELGCWLGCHR